MSYYGLLWVTMSSDEFLWTSGIINKNIVTHRNLYELIKFYSGDERDGRDDNEVGYHRNLPVVPVVSK